MTIEKKSHKRLSNNPIIRAWVVWGKLHLCGLSTHPFTVFIWLWYKMSGNWGRFGDRKVDQFWTIALLLSYLSLLMHINIHIYKQPFCTCKSIYATILHLYMHIYHHFVTQFISFFVEGLSENRDNISNKRVSNKHVIRECRVFRSLYLFGLPCLYVTNM